MSIHDLWNTVVEKQMLQEENGALRYDDDIRDFEKRSGEKMLLFPLFLLDNGIYANIYNDGQLNYSLQKREDLPVNAFSKYEYFTSKATFDGNHKNAGIESITRKETVSTPRFYDSLANTVYMTSYSSNGSGKQVDPIITYGRTIRIGVHRPVYIPLPASWLGDDRRCYCLTTDPAYTSYDVVCMITAGSTRQTFRKILWSFVQNEEKINEIPGSDSLLGKCILTLEKKLGQEKSTLSPSNTKDSLRESSMRLRDIAVLLYRLSGDLDDSQLEEITQDLMKL